MKYVVVENVPGYLPDEEPAMFASRRHAESYAIALAKELRSAGYRVSGSARDGFYRADDGSLGRVIEIIRDR